MNETFDVVPTRLAVAAMRDNGYKNAAYAIAELIDNSIQAGANAVELICCEQTEQLAMRLRKRVVQIAVIDNGKGMNADDLRRALQFGNGTRINDRSGMGRFGMGLPSSSISQCRRVEVWSWQRGVENALFTYLDLGEIERGETNQVPAAVPKKIPAFWLEVGENFGASGTLVVWTQLDRCIWKTAQAVIKNSEFIIGRMYRKFIHRGEASIRMVAVNADNPKDKQVSFAEPNDPLYLMTPSSCPEPFKNDPMFQKHGDRWEIPITVSHNDENHLVYLRFTAAKEAARETDQAGSRPHGRHAANNVGVSIVRAARELELSQSWVNSDPTERWWGAEIEFPPALDEVFGVSNNKQSARYLADAGGINLKVVLEGRTVAQAKEEMMEEGDPLGPILDIAKRVTDTLNEIRKLQDRQQKGMRNSSRKRHLEPDSPESRATQASRKRSEEGHLSQSDREDVLPPEQKIEVIEQLLIEQGQTKEVAHELAATTVSSGLKYVFGQDEIEGAAFFSVRIKSGTIFITLNTKHPAYKSLIEALDRDAETADIEELKERLSSAAGGLKLLLSAWARMEDETDAGDAREQLVDIRTDWGRMARMFLSTGA